MLDFKKMNFKFLILSLLFSSCNYLNCAPLWSSKAIEIVTDPFKETSEFTFNFKNDGQYPIELEQPTASCGCTIPTLQKLSYKPGEEGNITGTFKSQNRRGLNTVNIVVKGFVLESTTRVPFEDTLKLTAFVPELVGVTPGISMWKKDSELTEKTVRIEVKREDPLQVKFIGLNNDNYKGVFVEKFAGRSYEFKVTPNSTAIESQGMATFEATTSDGRVMRFSAHFIVR